MRPLLILLTLLLATPALSSSDIPVSPASQPVPVAGNASYAAFANGIPTRPDFFPIAVWLQAPHVEGHSGPHSPLAAAMKAVGINIAIGLHNWPSGFGKDRGEVAALKDAGIYLIASVDPADNTGPKSVASVQALVQAKGYKGLIGYNLGDEAPCGSGPGQQGNTPAEVAKVHSYDPTRPTFFNMTPWVPWAVALPQYGYCAGSLEQSKAAFNAPDVASFDNYPVTIPWFAGAGWACPGGAHVAPSNYLNVSMDCLWTQGLGAQQAIAQLKPGKPFWAYIDSGSSFGQAGEANFFPASVTSGSTTLTKGAGGKFTASWLGMTLIGTGIPADTTIVSITDDTHLVMSQAATATLAGGTVKVVGKVNGDCVAAVNLCVVNGNQYRSTPAQVNAQVWSSIINGASGIEWFCHDLMSISFCLGDQTGGDPAVARQVAANLTYINGTVQKFAPVLNSPTVGICTMQKANLSTTTSCAGGILSMTTSEASVPGMALVKRLDGVTYVLAQSDRRSAKGAAFTFTLTGLGGQVAKVVYDSNDAYDPPRTSLNAAFTLTGTGQFRDVLGANGADYQTKIYAIQ